jgi:carbonyl reductase 1
MMTTATSAITASGTTTSIGRVAVITGSNKGIGYYIALQLALSGLFEQIILACRDPQRASVAVQSIQQQLLLTATSTASNTISSPVTVTSQSLILGDVNSHTEFATVIEQKYGKIDCLINNAGFAYKNSDPTPFQQQTKPTLDINFRGTINLTEQLIPLLLKGTDPRIVNVASMSGRLSQVSNELQIKLSSDTLTMSELHDLINDFELSVQDGTYKNKGWSNSNYGISKLGVIAATRIFARQYPKIAINSCCPGYCKTDMTSQNGIRPPEDGAKNAVIPATIPNPPTGVFYSNYVISKW